MRRFPDLSFDAAIEAGLRACAVAQPELTDEHGQPITGVRPELVERCRALIADGLYETDERIDAAVNELADRLD